MRGISRQKKENGGEGANMGTQTIPKLVSMPGPILEIDHCPAIKKPRSDD